MSQVKKQQGKPDLFPPSWIVGPDAAAELARGDDDVLVAPELSEEDLKPLSGGPTQPGRTGPSFDGLWASRTASRQSGDLPDPTGEVPPSRRAASADENEASDGFSATRDDRNIHQGFSGADDAVTANFDEPDDVEIDALWHDMEDLRSRFNERERSTSRLRLEPTLSSASLAAAGNGPLARASNRPEGSSLGIRLAAAAAILLAVLAVGHRFDIPSAGFWEKTDGWVVDQATSVMGRLSTVIARD